MENNRDYINEFNSIIDGLSNSIESFTSEEIKQELKELGENPDLAQSKLKNIFRCADKSFKQRALSVARKEHKIKSAKLELLNQIPKSFKEKMELFNNIKANAPELSIACRDVENLDEGDLDSILNQLINLINIQEKENDTND